LSDAARNEVIKLDEELSRLQTRFGQNVVKDSNQFELVLENEEDLAGLPQSVRAAAAQEAKNRGHAGKYVFTIARSSITPFLQFSAQRHLRELMWKAYTRCAGNANEFDNNSAVARIAAMRAQRAQLLGYPSHADYILDDRMAATPAGVTALLDRIWQPAKDKVRAEATDLQARIQTEGGNFKLAPWDWWYYTEKLRAEKFSLDAETLKPYFLLENVRDGAFAVAQKLYGISFVARTDIPVYHEDIQAFEVRDHDNALIGLFLVDYFMRPSKRSGAWMNALRRQCRYPEEIHPIVFNVCNFPHSDPCLLGLEEVRTLFHEFGHALHGLLSKVRYRSLAGTSVKRDFVELPSQIMEHWAVEPEVMKSYARHYRTGEVISDELIGKILATQTFNQGFATTEYLAASYLDMQWHALTGDAERDVKNYENQAMQAIDLVEEVAPRYHSTYFQHIFSGGYSAGYYSYIWAEVLDTDGYQAFKENGIFDPATARSFRENILERGGSADPMELYIKFRGREPDVAPLLKSRGLN
jgi:peptidyl-dipeptidase Dcp